MGRPETSPPVKLILGIIARSAGLIEEATKRLEPEFGAVDICSPAIPFTHTSYYESEMGSPLTRVWLSHELLIRPEGLVRIKLTTNELEAAFSTGEKRCVNLDPGYLNLSRLILATTKDASHRIYLRNGIYAEVTLTYREHSWVPSDWTYPDYREKVATDFFGEVRMRYAEQLKGES